MKERLKKIVTNLLIKEPFFGYCALHLNFCEEKRIRNVGVDSDGNFYYNPHYLSKVSDRNVEIMIAHAVLHLILRHFTRMKGRDEFLWNISMDIEANYILYEIYGFLPRAFLMFLAPNHKGHPVVFGKYGIFKEMSAERIYEVLFSLLKEGKKINIKKSSEGMCLRIKKGGVSFLENLKEKIKGRNINKEAAGHDLHIIEKDEQGKGNGNGETLKNRQRGSLKEEEEKKWKRLGLEAYFHSKSIGKVPGIIEEIVNRFIHPRVPWNIVLRRYLSDISKDMFSWYPPNRRFVHQGLYLPSLYSPTLKIAVAIDTSGSISSKELVAFTSEINAIISSFPSYEIFLIQCDCEIHSEMKIFTGEFLPSSLKILGRGGTDFRPVFERLKDEEIKALIYLTDGLGEYPSQAPHYPVLWVISKSSHSVKPPFGTSIYIEVD